MTKDQRRLLPIAMVLLYVIIVLTLRVNTNLGLVSKVDILFQDRKLEKTCNDQSLLVRKYGPIRAKLLRRRLTVEDYHD